MIIRDPVQGDIEFSQAERRVLDTPEIQRLRGIRQLGTAHLVYPGCVHTRFDHSLGTLAMAKRIVAALRKNGYDVSAEDEEAVGVTALVHDVSHIPFGHTFEDERSIFPRHDNPRRLEAFLSAGQLGHVLYELGLQETVLEFLTAKKGEGNWRAEVVASTIDADLLDYLRRDSYFAGLSQAYDDRILSAFALNGDRLVMSMVKHHMDRPDTRSEIMHLLRMRYFLTERVYTHHAKIASGAMISKAVELAVGYGLREEHLYGLTDATFFDFLAHFRGTAAAPDPAVADLLTAVLERRLLKRAYVLTAVGMGDRRHQLIARYSGLGSAREELEERIRQALGLAPGQVVVYCPPAWNFKEVLVPVQTSRGVFPLGELDQPLAGEAHTMRQQYKLLWRFFVFVPPAQAVRAGRVCEDLLGERNEYTVSR